MEREWGTLLDVALVDVGVDVTTAAAAGATSLVVGDETLFEDEDRGALLVGGQVVDFTAFDVDTLTLTLADPLAAAVAVDDTIYLYDRARGDVVSDLLATVDIDEWDGEPITGVIIDDGVTDSLPIGPREPGTGEEVQVEYDPEEDEYTIVRTRGLGRARGRRWQLDEPAHVLTAADQTAGQFIHTLTYLPVEESVQSSWGGVLQPYTEYTVDHELGTVTWPLDGVEELGDEFFFHYQHLGQTPPPPPPPLDPHPMRPIMTPLVDPPIMDPEDLRYLTQGVTYEVQGATGLPPTDWARYVFLKGPVSTTIQYVYVNQWTDMWDLSGIIALWSNAFPASVWPWGDKVQIASRNDVWPQYLWVLAGAGIVHLPTLMAANTWSADTAKGACRRTPDHPTGAGIPAGMGVAGVTDPARGAYYFGEQITWAAYGNPAAPLIFTEGPFA